MKTIDENLLKELKIWINRREELKKESKDVWSKLQKNTTNQEEAEKKIDYLTKELIK